MGGGVHHAGHGLQAAVQRGLLHIHELKRPRRPRERQGLDRGQGGARVQRRRVLLRQARGREPEAGHEVPGEGVESQRLRLFEFRPSHPIRHKRSR